jgi:hypothetical protein
MLQIPSRNLKDNTRNVSKIIDAAEDAGCGGSALLAAYADQQDIAVFAMATASKLRQWQRRLVADAIDIGADLIKVKEGLGRGPFHAWLNEQFGEIRTAQRLMQVSAKFAAKRDTVSCLQLSTSICWHHPQPPNR